MFELKKGIDILSHVGGVKRAEEAEKIFRDSMDDVNFEKIQKIKNEDARLKIANAIAMGRPDSVFVNTGSPEDRQFIIDLSLKKKEESNLAGRPRPHAQSRAIRSTTIWRRNRRVSLTVLFILQMMMSA